MVNALPSVASYVSPTEDDKENLDPNSAEPRRNLGRRRRNPLYEYSNTGNNTDRENYDTIKSRKCWTFHNIEIYTTDTPNSSECCTLLYNCIPTEANISTEDSDTNKNGHYWVTLDGEMYAKGIGPLARVFGNELKTLKWLQSTDRVSLGKYNLSISFNRPLTSTPNLRYPNNYLV